MAALLVFLGFLRGSGMAGINEQQDMPRQVRKVIPDEFQRSEHPRVQSHSREA
jgi:hypothetical protein